MVGGDGRCDGQQWSVAVLGWLFGSGVWVGTTKDVVR